MTKYTIETAYEALKGYANRWGGDLLRLSKKQYDKRRLLEAQFVNWDLGFNFKKKQVCFSTEGLTEDPVEFAISVIHDMGHVFASKMSPMDDNYDGEFKFFGWEVCLTRQLGFSTDDFLRVNSDYIVDGYSNSQLKDLTVNEQVLLIRTSVEVATVNGLIKKGRVISIRR